ncbi:Na(+)/H(+) antiporter subunit C [Oceanobacillus alkalisoli]|uniref:Na(+)/H(+) antiporter subunit C n=1 Tax=Oceanobacillus alkalisoli TaxID=2925113 RepID=UPI001EF153C1|nr:Na(+)/H(+) antiporter subunit C [Oceanobacillus alkalisoli]MCF3943551.1 Na(+)/H(+) antiporter subunit C [Oceanobacillus alkalisoli]MCG5102816.1 Na(+)/H(+) antiporter subunit C [Oceanobacillus alkalisoli]
METLMIILTGVLVTIATYLVLSKSVIRVILGTAVYSHAAHLLIITMGGLKTGNVPILGDEDISTFVDPLPQALILTSIVISFAVTALVLVLAYRAYQTLGTDNMEELRGSKYE